jgi:hypothetical protein
LDIDVGFLERSSEFGDASVDNKLFVIRGTRVVLMKSLGYNFEVSHHRIPVYQRQFEAMMSFREYPLSLEEPLLEKD